MRNSINPFIKVIALVLFALTGMQTQWTAHAATSSTAPQNPQTGTWEQQAPYPTRFAINGVDMVTPTEAWVVAYTDILHTTDSGATWENQPRPGADNLYAVDFFDNQHGIAMGNTTLYTRDGGHTWSQSSGTFGEDVEMADANLAFITDHRVAGYMRSTDGGATWTFRTMPSNITTIQCFDSLNCVAASPSGVYHSYDGGLNWSFVAGQGVEFAGTYFVSHNQGWIVLGNNASHTTDGGTTWQVQTLPGGSWIYDVMFSDVSNGWAVGDNMVRTTDGGTTWQQVPLPPESLPLWDVDFMDTQHGIAGGDSFLNTESVIITSSDGGANWNTRTNGSINDVLKMVASDRDHAWATSDYGGKISRTTNGGRTWQVTEVGEQYIVLTGVDMADTLHGWTVGYDTTFLDSRIYHTSDGGATWQQQFDPNAQYLQGVAVLDAQTAIVVGGYSGSGSIRDRTTDGGATWHNLNVPIGAFFYDVFFLDSRTGWMVGGDGDIVKSTDGGDTWFVQNNPAQYTLASVHFSDPNNGWAGGYFGTLIRTTNGGATWTLQDPQIPEYTHVLAVSSTSPMRGWIAGYGGGAQSRPFVKYTTDGGATW
ncbi:MAG: YCF48-related protein, partial [Chloroflexota bacterium]